jgi:hypothetical protein
MTTLHGAVLGKGRQVDEIRHDGCPRVLMIGAVQRKFAEPMYGTNVFA